MRQLWWGRCTTIQGVSQYRVFHNTGCSTIHSVSQCRVFHNTRCFTIPNTGCTTIQGVPQYRVFHNTGCSTIQSVPQYTVFHNAWCFTILSVPQYNTIRWPNQDKLIRLCQLGYRNHVGLVSVCGKFQLSSWPRGFQAN